ncbi:MAG TPA: MBL fold metallo-hydrolase [Chitinivibrionales bacterium]|nr:MBL fold metallo-hydrolase [Chitinivibrionales bacterium]
MKFIFSCILLIILNEYAFPNLQKIHRISILGSNVFILESDSSLVMIDAGYAGHEKSILDTIVTLKKPLKLIFITHGHFDHYGCAKAVHDKTGAPIGVHRLDEKYLCEGRTPIDKVNFAGFFGRLLLPLAEMIWRPPRQCPDIVFNDNDSLDRFGLRAKIVHTPGHTPGSCSVIVQDSIAFVGDLLTNSPKFDKQRFYGTDWRQIDSSLVKLCRYKFSMVYIGHKSKTTDKAELLRLIKEK